MKAVVGVDLTGSHAKALDLFRRLDIGGMQLHFVNVVEPVLPDGSFPELAATHPLSQILDDLTTAGTEALSRVTAEWPGSTSQVAFGGAAATLIDAATDQSADLVVVGSTEKSMLESFFAGSVTKALTTNCEKPILLGKKQPKTESGLTVVVAHDMSEYCDRAIERFMSWAPKNISRIILVTADTTDASIVAIVERENPAMAGETVDLVQSRIEGKQAAIAEKLGKLGAKVETVVTQSSPKQAVNDAMRDANADLLILGAHGHGIIQRFVAGSLALHMVVREPHNVLLMRA